ncbi:MAG: GAF domain-containing protein [Bacteroidota bacterium]
MEEKKKRARYQRILMQLDELCRKSEDPIARMATISAVLHHKMEYFFWSGFYLLRSGELVVGPYQGPVACQTLAKNKGVCWAAVNSGASVVVEDVEQFPGHIACDSRSKSEIVVPVHNAEKVLVAVFDVDARDLNQFDDTDREMLEEIVKFIFREPVRYSKFE